MKKKGLLGIVAFLMVIALALTGCGQQGKQNAGATGSEGQNSTITDNGNANNGEAMAEPEDSENVGDEASNHNPEMKDGYYAYEVDGVEVLCKTNIWDYIDGDVWHRTEMFEALGYERGDSIGVARSPGFFRYVEDSEFGKSQFTAFVTSPTNTNSEDFIEYQYLNELHVGSYGHSIEVYVRCQQDTFATEKEDGPRTPIDIIVLTAYLLEQCQNDVNESYLDDIFSNADDGFLRIYE